MFLLSCNFLIEVLNEDLKDIILKYFYVKQFFNIYSEKKTFDFSNYFILHTFSITKTYCVKNTGKCEMALFSHLCVFC